MGRKRICGAQIFLLSGKNTEQEKIFFNFYKTEIFKGGEFIIFKELVSLILH